MLWQETRILNLITPLGDNELVLTSFRGSEHPSGLFEFELEMLSDNNTISANDLTGKNVSFSTELEDGTGPLFAVRLDLPIRKCSARWPQGRAAGRGDRHTAVSH